MSISYKVQSICFKDNKLSSEQQKQWLESNNFVVKFGRKDCEMKDGYVCYKQKNADVDHMECLDKENGIYAKLSLHKVSYKKKRAPKGDNVSMADESQDGQQEESKQQEQVKSAVQQCFESQQKEQANESSVVKPTARRGRPAKKQVVSNE